MNAGPTADLNEEAWDKAFEVDAKGVFLCSQAAIRKMIPRHGGRIVNIASIASMIVRTAQIVYCSAKADLGATMELIPAGRMAEEADHAHLIAYFASDESAHVTGQVVAVDGGQSLHHPFQMPHHSRLPCQPA